MAWRLQGLCMGTFELSIRRVMKPSVRGLWEVSHVKTLGVDCLPHDDVLLFLVQWVVYNSLWAKDVSIGGSQLGAEGERSTLVMEIMRLLDKTRAFLEEYSSCLIEPVTPSWLPPHPDLRYFAFLENVGNLLSDNMRPLLLMVLQALTDHV